MEISVIKKEDEEKYAHLPAFDFTKLSAINTCPTWGIIRYGLHKTFSTRARAMALEAGEACHQVFAAVRICDLFLYGGALYGTRAKGLAVERAHTLFGLERGPEFVALLERTDDDERTIVLTACLYILETSGFYDDPDDKRRTIDKLSEACIAYIDRYEFGTNLPYVQDGVDGTFVGIEIPFNLLLVDPTSKHSVRFTGRIDGVHAYKNKLDDPYIEENKTASRLGDAWEQSFELSHQVTGYMVAGRTILQKQIEKARIRGLAIPQPRVHDGSGLSNPIVFRRDHHFLRWSHWLRTTLDTYFTYIDRPLDAPQYTHSCNRYFRPCSFIPLCASDDESREEFFNEMVLDEWSPLNEKSGD